MPNESLSVEWFYVIILSAASLFAVTANVALARRKSSQRKEDV